MVLPTATLGVTVSVGVTVWQAGEGFEEALMRADQGLYLAKRAGRNRVVYVPA
ncbi:diguanylate cyclase [Roseomonas sp. TAS13]|nr:diguanylate cyclase [Roseomonas sp. TAS13]